MKLENSKKLFHEFPEIFNTEIDSLGFECQDGWFNLLYTLAGDVQEHINESIGKTDFSIIRVRQIMGCMRINAIGGDEITRNMLHAAEERSQSICELDGRPAEGLYVCAPIWFRFLCEKCARLHGCMTIEDYSLEHDAFIKEGKGGIAGVADNGCGK